MKVLFAVNNESISESIIKKYQQEYKEIISSKNVYYFDAITRELQKDKSYDRIVISEDVEPFTNNNYGVIDNFIFKRLDSISDEATSNNGQDIPIILICADRRTKSENILVKLFGIGIYSALIGQDRTTNFRMVFLIIAIAIAVIIVIFRNKRNNKRCFFTYNETNIVCCKYFRIRNRNRK